jgi:hypothetical protein
MDREMRGCEMERTEVGLQMAEEVFGGLVQEVVREVEGLRREEEEEMRISQHRPK